MKNERMRAAVCAGPNEIKVKDVSKPSLKPGEALLRVKATGICTTDRSFLAGERKGPFPIVLGHEIAATIEEIDKVAATDLKVGDSVGVHMWGCSSCYYCRKGHIAHCMNRDKMRLTKLDSGETLLAGGFAEYTTMPVTGLCKISPDVKPEESTFFEPLSCVIHSIHKTGVGAGSTAAVLGAGPMGMGHLLLMRKLGTRVFVSDPDDQRRKLARELDAELAINPFEEDPVKIIKNYTNGKGVEAVFVTTPAEDAIRQGIEMASPLAHVVQYASLHPSPISINVDPNKIHYKEVSYVGASSATLEEYQLAADLISTGSINVSPLISRLVSLDDIKKGFDLKPSGNIQRVVVIPFR